MADAFNFRIGIHDECISVDPIFNHQQLDYEVKKNSVFKF